MKTSALTDIGVVRAENQDAFYSNEQPVGNLPNLFVVADGMGGHVGGKQASETALQSIVETIQQDEETAVALILEHAIQSANHKVYEESLNLSLPGMGTTIVAATIIEDKVCVANVGDSRLYIVSPGTIRQITKDHSLVEEMVRIGEIDPSQARTHEKKNVITRAVGAAEDCKVDFFEVQLQEEECILMCSDGLTNMLDDEQIRNIINSQRDVIERTQKLIEAANNSGGKDNITAVVIEP